MEIIESENEITITTWNILAYIYDDKQEYKWVYRLPLIIQNLQQVNSDLICLQKLVLETAEKDFNTMFYQYDYIIDKVSKNRNNPIGNMILWKKDKFKLKDKISHSCAIHSLLIHNKTNKSLWLSNVHLKAGLDSGESQRHSEIKSCLKRLNNNLINKGYVVMIMCGDFNDNFTHHWDENCNSCKIYTELIQNNYVVHRTPISTCVNHQYWWAFDRLCTKGIVPDNIKVKCDFECDQSLSIPNSDVPSDHLSLTFTLLL